MLTDKREAVALTMEEWESVNRRYEAMIAPATLRLKRAMLLAVPAMIATVGVIANTPALDALVSRVDHIPGLKIVQGIALIAWLPLLGLWQHRRAVRRADRHIEAELSSHPRVPMPEQPRLALHQNLEILVMLLFGPVILIHAFGTAFPDAFRNTPLSGSRLGLFDLAAAIAFLAWRLTKPRQKQQGHS
ncbi:MAG: hypothetical protein QM676_10505 [Novosphingobium sp.]